MEKNYLPFTIKIHVLVIEVMYLYIGFKVCGRFLSQTNIRNRALLIKGYKNVLLIKETMTHLRWLCELERCLCYIFRSSIQIFLGCIQWQASSCTTRVGAQRIIHPNYNPSNLNNDIALLRFNNAVGITGSMFHRFTVCCFVCVVRPRVFGVQYCGLCTS